MSEPHEDPLPSINFERTLAGSGDTDVPISEADKKLLEAIPQVADIDARFETIGLLGRGGMGEVSLSRDRSLGRRVAIKRVRPELVGNAGALLRFWNEAKGVAAINHPHVVQIHEFFRSPQGCFLVMEYVDGESLADRLREDGPLSVEEVREIGRSICGALAAAHQQGLIHRDIKPANVLLSKQGVAKLVDFGLVRMTAGEASLTRAGAVLGTFEFMPPEQLEDPTQVDARSDVWSLGATLYKAATGGNVRVIRPHKIPDGLRDVLLKALEDDPADRFQTADEFAAALANGLAAPPAQKVSTPTPPPAPKVITPTPPPEPKPVEAVPLIAPFDAATAVESQKAWARSLGLDSHIQRNSLGMELVLIPPGEYLRGSTDEEILQILRENNNLQWEWFAHEQPSHYVQITLPFWLGTTSVTQGQWSAIMESKPWRKKTFLFGKFKKLFYKSSKKHVVKDGDSFPATYVSHTDSMEFCRRLSEKEGKLYRLLSEAEWEYACRAGSTSRFNFGCSNSDLSNYAWFETNSLDNGKIYAHEVAQKQPNSFGLHDMHGNVWEWCSDCYDANEYKRFATEKPIDPKGVKNRSFRVGRGGSCYDAPVYCRSANRFRSEPGSQYGNLGFRVAQVVSGQ